MEYLIQLLVSGLAIGAIYGLIGMALAISYYVTRVINFAQGQLMMLAMMATATLFAAGYPAFVAVSVGFFALAWLYARSTEHL